MAGVERSLSRHVRKAGKDDGGEEEEEEGGELDADETARQGSDIKAACDTGNAMEVPLHAKRAAGTRAIMVVVERVTVSGGSSSQVERAHHPRVGSAVASVATPSHTAATSTRRW